MPDKVAPPQSTPSSLPTSLPVAPFVWLFFTVLLFVMSTQIITMRDAQRFPNDFELVSEPTDEANTVLLHIRAGTFEYEVRPFEMNEVMTGTFEAGADVESPTASRLFNAIPDVVSITIETQTITIVYDNDIEADLMLRRSQNPVINAVLNERDTITGSVAEDAEKTLIFTTTDATWLYGRYVPALIPVGEQEVYTNRDEGLAGTALSRFIFERMNTVEALTIYPDRLLLTYREGASETQVINRLTEALDAFHPRASLDIHLWLLTLGFSNSTLIDFIPIPTGISLFFFTLFFALVELGLFVYFRDSDDKLVRPLVRVVGVFLFFWSIYGHEPLWDYLMGLLFPTSNQLIYPSATVIDFTAQHLELVFVSSLITVPGGLLFGILVTRDEFREMLPLINNLVNSGQTVPTIAVVAFMAPVIGFGFWPAIIALVAYGLLPVVRNTIAGLEAVNAFIVDSARGMGMTATQILFQIELPIASRVIMAGIRTSMVINVGTATLGAFVGSGGLGTPIASGLAMTIDAFILLGALPAATLAILIDYVLGRIEYVFTPRGLQIES